MRRIFGKWPSHIGRDARRQARDPLRSPSWRALPLPPLLESVAENVALAPISACSRIWSVSVPSSLRRQAHWPRPSRAFLPREDKATAMRVLSLSGEALGVVVGAGRFYADPEGFRLASLSSGPLPGGGGDDERGTLGRDAALHIPACVRSRHGALRQAAFHVAAHGAVDAYPEGSRERRWSRGSPRSWVEKKADAATGACSSADPKGRGSERPPPDPERRARP